MRYLTPIPKQFVDQSGVPYSDGTVSVYLSGDTEFANIYEAAEGDALCPNPCTLDSNGAWQCFVPAGIPLDYIVKDKNGNVVFEFYDIVPGGGDSSICNIIGVEGETKVTERVNAEGSVTATVGLDPEFKQQVTDAENDIEDLSERVDGVEGSINEINNEVDELDGKVDEAVEKAETVEQSLANKKDRQEPYSVTGIPSNRTISGFSQDADGRMNIQTQEINYPDSQINISSPEDTLDITKYTPSPNTQDFHADVKDHSLTARKLKVSEFKYLDVDGDTIEKDVDGNCVTLKVKNPIPAHSSAQADKVLTVESDGTLGWKPPAQVNTDWEASSGVAELLNKPNLAYKYSTDTATTQLKGIQYGQNSNGDWHHQIIINNGVMQSVGWGVPTRPSASANLVLTTDSNGKMQWTPKYDGAKRSHTAELYLHDYDADTDSYNWHVRNIQNYCVKHVAVTNRNHDICSVLIEAPTLAAGEEYDYVVVFDCNNSTGSCNVSVENCDPEIEIKWEVDTTVSPIMTYAIDVTYTEVSWSGSPQYQIEVIGGRWQRHRF